MPKKQLIDSFQILRDTVNKFLIDDCLNLSASIAFYTIFSLPALLIFILMVAGTVFGEESVRKELLDQISLLVGTSSAQQVDKIIANAGLNESTFLAKVIGTATLTFSATTVFIAIQKALNHIWAVRPAKRKAYLNLLFSRLLSFSLVIGFGFVMLASLLIDTLLNLFSGIIERIFSSYTYYVVEAVNFGTTLLVISLIFSLIFKMLPDAIIRWKQVIRGALFSALLFILGKFLIGLYLGSSGISSTYGAAGSLVLILVWVYYISAILLLGAEFTQVYTTRRGGHILPKKGALKIQTLEVEDWEKYMEEKRNSEK